MAINSTQKIARLKSAFRHYVPLTLFMTRALLRKEFAGTMGGVLWWVAEPIFYFGIYYFVFAVIFQTRTENFVAFLLTGLVIWRWFTVVLNQGTNSVFANKRVMRQIDVPKIIFPVQVLLMETYKFFVGFALLMLFLAFKGDLSWHTLWWLPFVFFLAMQLFLGVILITSAIAPLFPDIRNLIRMSLRGLLFLSGVFYEPTRIPEDFRTLFYMNPLASLLDIFRGVLLYGQPPVFEHAALVFGLGVVLMAIGFKIHVKLNRIIPRYTGA